MTDRTTPKVWGIIKTFSYLVMMRRGHRSAVWLTWLMWLWQDVPSACTAGRVLLACQDVSERLREGDDSKAVQVRLQLTAQGRNINVHL